MPDFQQLIQSGSAHVWLYIPVAILLGALHGLEPGHSKTMMAAFIIAIRGTVWQAVLLGLSAAISHSLIIWLLAGLALTFGSQWNAESTEPYFHLVSATLVFLLAVWMFVRTRRDVRAAEEHQQRKETVSGAEAAQLSRDIPIPFELPQSLQRRALPANEWADGGGHSHLHAPTTTVAARAGEVVTSSGLVLPAGVTSVASNGAASVRGARANRGPHGGMLLDTGHGWLEVEIASSPLLDGAARFRIHPCRANGEPVPLPKKTQIGVETSRLDGSIQKFAFETKDGFWESTGIVPAPHEFVAVISLGHADHAHTYRLRFREEVSASGMAPAAELEPEPGDAVYEDAHERAHAQDIARRFGNRPVTTPQIVLFGVTGGLMPCPAAFTILLVCLQIKRVTLGFALVAAFSIGLALTMVAVGVIAAWGTQHAAKRMSSAGFSNWVRRAPYFSCVLLILLAAFMAYQGWHGLVHGVHPHAH